MDISVCSIMWNEEDLVAPFIEQLQSFSSVKEIILVDTGSDDRSVEIAKSYNVDVYEYEWGKNFGQARKLALEKGKCEWIAMFDLDMMWAGADPVGMFERLASQSLDAYNVIGFRYLSWFDWNTLWFEDHRSGCSYRVGDEAFFDTYYNMFRRSEMVIDGSTPLHEGKPFPRNRHVYVPDPQGSCALDQLHIRTFLTHYSECKLWEAAIRTGTSYAYRQGVKNSRMREISALQYTPDFLCDAEFVRRARAADVQGDPSLMVQMGMGRINEFMTDHNYETSEYVFGLHHDGIRRRFSGRKMIPWNERQMKSHTGHYNLLTRPARQVMGVSGRDYV